MAYVKTNWKTGDVVTSNKLNNMETGIYDANEASASAFAPDIDNPQDGDIIKYDGTAGKWVNGSASGGSGGSLKVTVTVDTSSANMKMVMDKTWQEIYDAFSDGNFVGVLFDNEGVLFQMPITAMQEYGVAVNSNTQLGVISFTANSANDYPAYTNPI